MNSIVYSTISICIAIIAAFISVWNVRRTGVWRREDQNEKQPNVRVEALEWVKSAEGGPGSLQITLKNYGARSARNITADVRFLDYSMTQRPAPDFKFGTGNDLPQGSQFSQAKECNLGQLPVSRAMALINADDPMTRSACPPSTFYFMWGEPSPKYDKMPPEQPFRPMSPEERIKTDAYLAGSARAEVKGNKESVLMIPGMPDIQLIAPIGNEHPDKLLARQHHQSLYVQ